MNHSGTLGSLAATAVGPCTHLLRSGSEERLKIEELIGSTNEAIYTRLLQSYLVEEHLALLVGVKFSNFALGLCCHNQNLSALVLHSLAHLIHIFVALYGTVVIYVAHIEHRLVGEQEEVVGGTKLVFSVESHSAGSLALLQSLLKAQKHVELKLGSLVATGSSLLLHAGDTALDSLQVLNLQLIVDNLLVAHRVDRAIYVGDVAIVEAAEHMNNGISLANVGKELVTETFTLRRALHQSGNIHDFHRGGNNLLGIHQLGELVESLIGHGNHAHIRLDGAKREICRLRLGVRQTVKQR